MNYKKQMAVAVVALAVCASAAWAGSSGATNTVNKTMDASLAGGAKLQSAVVTSLDSIVEALDTVMASAAAVNAANLTGAVPAYVTVNASVTSNLTGKVHGSNITVTAGGSISSPGVWLTNTTVAADGKTNTYVLRPAGDGYIFKSVTTSP